MLALRNRVFFKLAARNVARRRGRTALIVIGLMLGTAIISSALNVGDTVSHTIRSSVTKSLGQTDERISVKATEAENVVEFGEATGVGYFDEAVFDRVERVVQDSSLVDGLAPAIIESVALQDRTTRQTEPRVTLFAADPRRLGGFGAIEEVGGGTLTLSQLSPGRVYLNADAADSLRARAGDDVVVYAAGRPARYQVEAVVRYDGTGGDAESVLMPLAEAQDLLGLQGRVKHILVSNAGGETSGEPLTDDVVRLLRPELSPLGLEADPVKQDGLEAADAQGRSFMSLFTTFGTFSIAAGILLIFLIFVMLAAERRAEMGIARAIGTQRGHLVETFLFEGALYDIAAAAVGAALGLVVALAMVSVLAEALGSTGLDIEYSLSPSSVLVAYTLGVLLTLVVVTASAWRVSVLNIVSAIRNLPEQRSPRTRRARAVGPLLGVAVGIAMVVSGVTSKQGPTFLVGVSVVIASLVPLARGIGVGERVAFTTGGLALVFWWLLPFSVYDALVPGLSMNFSVWVMSGLMVVLGATWTIMYNADVLLAFVTRVFGRLRSVAPVLRTAVAYPMRSRLRTGMTLAMFTLVVFTLVVGTTTSSAFTAAVNDEETFGGGFDVRATTSPASPIDDMRAAISVQPSLRPSDFAVVASQSFLPVEARQANSTAKFEPYPVRGLDDDFLENTTFGLAAKARGYASADAVWKAIADNPGYAVVDSLVVPRRANWNFGVLPPFRLSGFDLEDGTFDPIPVEMRDPQTGTAVTVTVIGVLKDTAPFAMAGISTSQMTVAPFGERVRPTVFYFALAESVDASRAARKLESAFLENGMEAETITKVLAEAVGASTTFQRLLLGFIGLGLVVGVAALGVISARSVVERRQQIGVLRAIGFQRKMVQRSFMLEASFIALTSIVVGTALGLVVAFNVIDDSSKQASWDRITFAVPWMNLAIIFGAVYATALGATFVSARRGARIVPADALRYQ